MVTTGGYEEAAARACKSVLIELADLCADIELDFVIIGGWVPSLVLPESPKEPHIGSLDVDLALETTGNSPSSIEVLTRALIKSEYEQRDTEMPFRFVRELSDEDGRIFEVPIDLMTGEGVNMRPGVTYQRLHRGALVARGCDLAFLDSVEIELEGELPSGKRKQVAVRLAGAASFLIMKSIAIESRLKEKDSYDIYYFIKNFPGGVTKLAGLVRPWLDKPIAVEALGSLAREFSSVDEKGPRLLANFYELSDKDEREVKRRDAFETINAFLELLKA